MVSIEKIKREGTTYFYIAKNFRVGFNKWKKIRKYIGKEEPTKAQIAEMAEEIENEARVKGLIKHHSKHEYLTDQEAEIIEDISDQFKQFLLRLPKESASKY